MEFIGQPKQGLPGPQGPAGTDGAPGRDGLPGADGAPGRDGAQGVQGIPGMDGAPGRDGATGPQGMPGADGHDGAPGIQGIQGLKGDTGNTGATGPSGVVAATAPITYAGSTVALSLAPTNLRVNAGSLDTIQDIAATATPTFAGITTPEIKTDSTNHRIGVGTTAAPAAQFAIRGRADVPFGTFKGKVVAGSPKEVLLNGVYSAGLFAPPMAVRLVDSNGYTLITQCTGYNTGGSFNIADNWLGVTSSTPGNWAADPVQDHYTLSVYLDDSLFSLKTAAGYDVLLFDKLGNLGLGRIPTNKLSVDGGLDVWGANVCGFTMKTTNYGGTWNITNYGPPRATEGSNALRFASASADSLYLLYGGGAWFPGDSKKVYFGTALKASICFDGTNLVLNPKESGAGIVSIAGGLAVGTGATGTFTSADGKTVTVTSGIITSIA